MYHSSANQLTILTKVQFMYPLVSKIHILISYFHSKCLHLITEVMLHLFLKAHNTPRKDLATEWIAR